MNTKKQKNKIKTPGYFIKRLRDNQFGVIRLFQNYNLADSRIWTVMVDPGNTSVFITCYKNRDFEGDVMFEISDGSVLFPKNFSVKTESIEVILAELIKRKVGTISTQSSFYTSKDSKE